MKPKSLIAILISVIIISSCSLIDQNNGALEISVVDGLSAQTLLPAISMDIAAYDIYGSGPDGESFEELDYTNQSLTVPSLAFGSWTVTINGKNADGTIIGTGFGTTVVHTNDTSTVSVTVIPLSGIGTLDVTVNWNAEDTDIPSIDSELLAPSGASRSLTPFTISGENQGTSVTDDVETGYHTLIIKLQDNLALTMGAVEVVRIVKEETTSGAFDFYEINKPGGTIQVNIEPEMDDPLEVSMSGAVAELAVGESMTVSASVTDPPSGVLYVWYINGESQDTGDTYVVNGVEEGVYRLDVTAFTADGTRAGSASHEFHVIEEVSTGAKMYWSESQRIKRANVDGSEIEELVNTGPSAGSNGLFHIAVDKTADEIYWTSYHSSDPRKVQKANSDGSNVQTLVTVYSPNATRGLDLDVAGGKVIWTDYGVGEIHRANMLDGSSPELLFTGLFYPGDLAIDPVVGKMYWPDYGSNRIQRANIDGTGSVEDVITGISAPVAIELDVMNGKIYWASWTTGKIHRANMDGTGLEDLPMTGLTTTYGIALDIPKGKIYWTVTADPGKIQRSNLDGTMVEDVLTGLVNPHAIELDL